MGETVAINCDTHLSLNKMLEAVRGFSAAVRVYEKVSGLFAGHSPWDLACQRVGFWRGRRNGWRIWRSWWNGESSGIRFSAEWSIRWSTISEKRAIGS